jgi:hypothetical protein
MAAMTARGHTDLPTCQQAARGTSQYQHSFWNRSGKSSQAAVGDYLQAIDYYTVGDLGPYSESRSRGGIHSEKQI